MTIQEIRNTPEIVDFMLDKSVITDSRIKLYKRLEEICELAIKALEQTEPGLKQKILRLEEENKKLKQEVRTLYDEAAEAHELGVEQI